MIQNLQNEKVVPEKKRPLKPISWIDPTLRQGIHDLTLFTILLKLQVVGQVQKGFANKEYALDKLQAKPREMEGLSKAVPIFWNIHICRVKMILTETHL